MRHENGDKRSSWLPVSPAKSIFRLQQCHPFFTMPYCLCLLSLPIYLYLLRAPISPIYLIFIIKSQTKTAVIHLKYDMEFSFSYLYRNLKIENREVTNQAYSSKKSRSFWESIKSTSYLFKTDRFN